MPCSLTREVQRTTSRSHPPSSVVIAHRRHHSVADPHHLLTSTSPVIRRHRIPLWPLWRLTAHMSTLVTTLRLEMGLVVDLLDTRTSC
jgi:hypothetical protein